MKDLENNFKVKFKTMSDTEVILMGYEIYGITFHQSLMACLHLQFGTTSKKLILARDKFGEKPLFYLNDNSNGLILVLMFHH